MKKSSSEISGGSAGLLLLDALLAMVILSTALLVILQSLSEGMRAAVLTAAYTQAALVMDNKWFEMEAKKVSPPVFRDEKTVAHNGKDYLVFAESKKSAGQTAGAGLYDLQLKISWVSGTTGHELTSASYVLDPSLENHY